MQNIVFTIVAKNYIGLAQVLEESVNAHSSDVQFYIIVSDELVNLPELPLNVLSARKALNLPDEQWEQMAFKYNLVEFCTAIKPYCFDFFFKQKDAGKTIYLDPDILAYSSLNPIFDELGRQSILITPHILNMHSPFKGDYPDHLFLVNGIFNLGFIAVNNTVVAQQFLQWWQYRMIDGAYFDNDMGLATDQKWINFLPAIIPQDELVISRNAGMNAAPWNFFERELFFDNGNYFVKQRENSVDTSITSLIFVHFSGYNYKSLINRSVSHKTEGFQQYKDWKPAFELYANSLEKSNFLTFVSLPYSYNFFNNGRGILSLHRRFYRRMLEAGNQSCQYPFATDKNSLYSKLKNKRLIDHTKFKGNADSVTHKTIRGFDSKLKWINLFFFFNAKGNRSEAIQYAYPFFT